MDKIIERAYKKAGVDGFEKFTKTANYIADNYCSFPNGGRDTIVWTSAVDMAVGAELVKKKYFIAGIVVGVIGLYSTKFIMKKISKD